jgi:glycosyltransferase involved in cell wall biosynthesis/ABC-type transporter Mla subunit MlaD
MTENPLVSVIVRTKDRPKLLKRALRSIADQTYRPIEVVLVNDGGCDLDVEEMKTILGDVSLHYIKLEKNEGRAFAGNVGIENAKGDYIGFLDDDDEFYPKHIVTLVSFLQQSDYEVAYTDSLMVYKEYNPETRELNELVKREVVFSYDFDYNRLVFENYIPFMCLLFRRNPLVTSGGFGDKFDLYEDWDLLIRIAKKYPFYHIKQVTANYNQWSTDYQISQVHKDPNFLRQAYLKVLSKHIDKITPDRIHDYMSSYVHTRNMLKGVSNEREHFRNVAREKESQVAELDAELRRRTPEMDRLSGELKEKDARMERLGAELQEKGSQIEKLYAELQEKGPRVDYLYNELKERDAQIEDVSGELKEHVSRLHALSDEIGRRDAQIEALNAKLNEREIQTNNLIAELRERTPQIDTLNTKLNERELQINNLIAEMREQGSRVEAFLSKLKDKDTQVETLGSEVRERASQIEILSAELRERTARIDFLSEGLKTREAQITNLIAELREKGSRIEGFLAKLKDKDKQVETLSSEMRERASQIEILSAELRERTARVQTLSVELRDREARLTSLQNNVKDRENLIAAMKNTKGWKVLEKYRKIRDRIFLSPSSRKIQGGPPQKMGTGLKRTSVAAPDLHRNSNVLSSDVVSKPIPAKVSVIIPTRDAGDEFDYTLRRITQQEGVGEIELVVIDSGSKDKTVDLSGSYTQKVFQIPHEEFHHARTRNFGAEKATGDFLVFTVQDAVPVGNNWLYKLIRPIHEGRASAVSARQIPRADADLFASWAMWLHNIYLGYNHDRVISSAVAKDFDHLDLQGKRAMASLDSVCLAIKKATFDSYRFNSGYAEDVDLGIRLIKDDHTLLFQSSNAIIHSHNRPAMYFLKRGYVDTVSLWDILKIERKSVPVGDALETLGYLYSLLKTCVFSLSIDCEMKKDPLLLIHSFLDNFEKRMTAYDTSLQPAKGDPLLDNFFVKVTPGNHQEIAREIFAAFKGSVLSFADFMKCLPTVDDVKEDFLMSIYKLFSSAAGNYLAANTQGRIDSVAGGI